MAQEITYGDLLNGIATGLDHAKAELELIEDKVRGLELKMKADVISRAIEDTISLVSKRHVAVENSRIEKSKTQGFEIRGIA